MRKRQLEGGGCLPCTLNKPHYKEPQKEEEGRKESQKELQRLERRQRDGGDCGVHRATEEPGASAPGDGGDKVSSHRGASQLLEYVCGRQLEGVPVVRGNGDNGAEWGRKGSGSQGAAGGVDRELSGM